MAVPDDTVKLVPITYVGPITPGGANLTITGTPKVSGLTTSAFVSSAVCID
jgi:hypothetical protein